MRIGIIGAGAIGCVVGGLLTKAGRDVTLIDQWPEHVETMRRQGLRLSGTCGEHTVKVKALHLHEAVALARVTTNLFGERWSKLAVSCMANPLAGVSGFGSAEGRSEPVPRRIALRLAAEVVRVGRASGHEIEPIYGLATQRFLDAAEGRGLAELEADIAASARHLSGGRPSLLQDVLRKRRTEIDDLNGYVVAEGRRLGVPTPVNAAVVELYHRHGVGTLTPDPKNLEPLARLV